MLFFLGLTINPLQAATKEIPISVEFMLTQAECSCWAFFMEEKIHVAHLQLM